MRVTGGHGHPVFCGPHLDRSEASGVVPQAQLAVVIKAPGIKGAVSP